MQKLEDDRDNSLKQEMDRRILSYFIKEVEGAKGGERAQFGK